MGKTQIVARMYLRSYRIKASAQLVKSIEEHPQLLDLLHVKKLVYLLMDGQIFLIANGVYKQLHPVDELVQLFTLTHGMLVGLKPQRNKQAPEH